MNLIHAIASGAITSTTNYAQFEMWNPATSGVDVLVYHINLNCTGSGVLLKTHTDKQGSTAKTLKNKLLGGTALTFEFYGDDEASAAGTTVLTLDVVENVDKDIDFLTPLIIEPGKSLTISAAAKEKDLYTFIECVQRTR